MWLCVCRRRRRRKNCVDHVRAKHGIEHDNVMNSNNSIWCLVLGDPFNAHQPARRTNLRIAMGFVSAQTTPHFGGIEAQNRPIIKHICHLP